MPYVARSPDAQVLNELISAYLQADLVQFAYTLTTNLLIQTFPLPPLLFHNFSDRPSPEMGLKLQGIDPEADFYAISTCLFESHEDPPQKFFHLWFPIHGNDEQARENAIEEGAIRLKRWHTEDPSSNWRKVVDTESGRIAGAALWNIHHENPFAVPDQLEVTWFPTGSAREFVEQMIMDYDAPRAQAAQKPHICKHL